MITGLSHLSFQGTVFRLSNLEEQDQWLKLKLTEESRGYPFLLLRKVLDFSQASSTLSVSADHTLTDSLTHPRPTK